jgi:hypothetical protein
LTLSAQSDVTFMLTADSLRNGASVELSKLDWKYQPGDDPRFADPQFDDHSWGTLKGTAITLAHIPQGGWRGVGWFRLRLRVDPTLVTRPLALVMAHYGASEVYLDGKLAQRFGAVGTTRMRKSLTTPTRCPSTLRWTRAASMCWPYDIRAWKCGTCPAAGASGLPGKAPDQ